MLKCGEPVLIVMRAVVRLAAVGRSLKFVAKRAGPFAPRKMPLLGKLHRERKRLRLPWLGEYRPIFLARQARQRINPLYLDGGIRLAQGNRPTYRYRRHLVAWLGRPTAHVQRSAPNTRAAASHRGNGRWCPGRERRHDRGLWCRI